MQSFIAFTIIESKLSFPELENTKLKNTFFADQNIDRSFKVTRGNAEFLLVLEDKHWFYLVSLVLAATARNIESYMRLKIGKFRKIFGFHCSCVQILT
jgi:hypothetical protein